MYVIVKTILISTVLFLSVSTASAASLFLAPSKTTLRAGDTFTIRVAVNSEGTSVNALSGVVTIPAGITIESISRSNSIVSFWVTEPSRSGNRVSFEGVALNGYQGTSGTILTMTARANREGAATLSFASGQVLANDGQGTDVTNQLRALSLSVAAAPVVAPKTPAEPAATEEPEIVVTPPVVTPVQTIDMVVSYYCDGIRTWYQTCTSLRPRLIGTTTLPNTAITLSFTKEAESLSMQVFTGENGSFSVDIPSLLGTGTYDIRAVLPDGTSAVQSVPVTHAERVLITHLIWSIGIIGILLCYIIIRSLYSFYTLKKMRNAVHTEAHELKNILEKSFALLEEDIALLIKKRSTITSGQLIEVKDDLAEAEKVISKEISDIEKKSSIR